MEDNSYSIKNIFAEPVLHLVEGVNPTAPFEIISISVHSVISWVAVQLLSPTMSSTMFQWLVGKPVTKK